MRSILAIMLFGKTALIISILSLCFQTYSYAADIKLQWNANTEPDLDHYVIYWGIGFDPPYGHNSGNKGDFIGKNATTYTVTGLSDGKTYYFVAKAVDTEGLVSDYSNIVSTDDPYGVVTEEGAPPSGSGAGGGGCFIATAAYGSNMDRHVKILTEFRDRHLLTNSIGRDILHAYYTFSPPLADYLKDHEILRGATRLGLMPIVYSVAYPKTFFLIFFSTILGVTLTVRERRSRRT